MKETFWKGLVIVVSVIATLAIVGWVTTSSLTGELDDTKINAGILWFSAFGFITGSWGLVALVWTFYEQRKLTEAQSRAYIEIIGVSYEPFPGYRGATFRMGVKNVGSTPASDICVTGVQEYDPGAIEGRELGEIVNVPFEFLIPGDLPAQAENVGRTNDIFKVPEDELTIEKFRPFGTESCRDGRLTFRGSIKYLDAFNRVRLLPFDVNATILRSDSATELSGASRSTYSNDEP